MLFFTELIGSAFLDEPFITGPKIDAYYTLASFSLLCEMHTSFGGALYLLTDYKPPEPPPPYVPLASPDARHPLRLLAYAEVASVKQKVQIV